MPKYLILLFILPRLVFAQSEPQNSLKINAVGAFSKILAIQYERKLGNHFSFNNTFFYRAESQIPLGSQFDKLAKKYSLGLTGVDFQYIYVDQAKIGVKGYSPELRYYIGEHKNRFFVAAFGQYENFDALIPASMEARYNGQLVEISKVPIDFKIITLSGGILIGKQFMLTDRIALDVVVIGPHFGKSRKVYATVSNDLLSKLNDNDKAFLEDKIRERYKLSEKYYDVSVSDEKAEINAFRKVPYAGIRGLGFNLGFYF